MATFQGLFLLALGIGLVAVSYRSLATGWLPCGPNGIWRRLEFRRAREPARYWLMFALYGLGGLWIVSLGIGILFGTAEPLPLN